MSDSAVNSIGSIGWHDLTVENAEGIRHFYSQVVGWESMPLSMGEYDDFVMTIPGTEEGVAGICHARGPNASIPPQWLIYVTVKNVDQSIQHCSELGGKVINGPRTVGQTRFCIVQDPAGAVIGLIEAKADANGTENAPITD